MIKKKKMRRTKKQYIFLNLKKKIVLVKKVYNSKKCYIFKYEKREKLLTLDSSDERRYVGADF